MYVFVSILCIDFLYFLFQKTVFHIFKYLCKHFVGSKVFHGINIPYFILLFLFNH